MFIIEFYRVRGTDEAHAILDRVEHDATDLEDAKVRALSLFETLDMPQKPDAVRILDHTGDEVFVWGPPARSCRRTGRCRCPTTGGRCCGTRCPRRSPRRRSTREQVVGIGTDFTACTFLPTLADGTPLCELDGSPTGRTRTRSCGSTTPPSGTPTASTRWRPSAARRGWPATAARSRRSGSSPRRCRCSRRTRRSTPGPSAASRRPTGSSGSSAGSRPATPAPPATRAIYPDGGYPSRRLPRRAQPGLRRLRGDQAGPPALAARRARRAADGRGGCLDRPARGHRRRRRQRRRPRDRAAAANAVRARPAGRHHGHLDLPRDELRHARRGARHVRRRRRTASCPDCGATRPGRAASATSSRWFVENSVPPEYRERGRPAGIGRPRAPDRPGRGPAGVGEHGLVALDWHSGNRSVLVDHDLSGVIVGQTLATRPEDQYRALIESTAFGTRTIVEAFEGPACRSPSSSSPAGC